MRMKLHDNRLTEAISQVLLNQCVTNQVSSPNQANGCIKECTP
jgi:hypothetical protein